MLGTPIRPSPHHPLMVFMEVYLPAATLYPSAAMKLERPPSADPPLEFTVATEKEFEEILAMSKGIYGGLDYLPSRYHAWIREPNRTVVLAKKNGSVVRTLGSRGASCPGPSPSSLFGYCPAVGRGLGQRLQGLQRRLKGQSSDYCYGACGETDLGPSLAENFPQSREL